MKKRSLILLGLATAFLLVIALGGIAAVKYAARTYACNVMYLGVRGELLTSDAFYAYDDSYTVGPTHSIPPHTFP